MNFDERSFPQLYKILEESERELYSVRYICLNEPECALISFSSLEFKKKQFILEGLIQSRPPYKELFNCQQLISTPNFHWFCFCISKFFNIDINLKLLPLLLKILRDDRSFQTINKIIEAINKMYNNQFPDLINSKIDTSLSTKYLSFLTTKDFEVIISLSLTNPPLFRAFLPYFEVIFNVIDINNFFHQYGRSLLPIMDIEKLNLKSVTFNEYSDLEDIIQKTILDHFYYNNYIHSYNFITKNTFEFKSTTTFLLHLQNNFFETNPFPNKTFFGHFSLLYSLLNTSLTKQEHFIDIAGKRFIELFQQNDYKNGLDAFFLIPEMESWAVVAIYNNDKFRNNLAFLPEVIQLLPQDLKPNLSTEFLNRINNDNQFKIHVTQLSGSKSVDLLTHSIPFFFKQCLNPNGPLFDFENIFQKPLLSYSDDERTTDCDFIVSYFAIVNEMKCIIDEENIDDHLFNMNQSLRYLSNNYEKHNSIMIDLFSLIFLQADGNFICSIDAANKILPLLSSYIISDSFLKIFTKNLKKVNISSLLFPEDKKLDHALLPFSSLFDLTLSSHDWELAKQMEGNNFKLKIKRIVFNETYNFSQNNQTSSEITDEKSIQSLFVAAEIGLSYEDQITYLKIAKSNLDDFDLSKEETIKINSKLTLSSQPNIEKTYNFPLNELKYVINNRKNYLPLQIPTCNKKFYLISEKLQKMTSTEWKKTIISSDYYDCKLFCDFFSYLDSFIPVVLDSNYAETVVDALSIKHDKLIFGLYSQNKMKDVTQVANALKMDIFESLILHSYKNTEMKLPFIKEYPIINFAESLFSDTDEDNKTNNNDDDEKLTLKRILNNDYDKLSTQYTFNSTLFTKLNALKNTSFYSYLKNQTSIPQKQAKQDKELDLEQFDKYDDLFYINNVPTVYYEKVLSDLVQKVSNSTPSRSTESTNTHDIEKISETSFLVSADYFEGIIMKSITKIELNDLQKISETSNCTDKLVESISILVEVSKDFQPVFPLENSFRHLLSTGLFKLASDLCRNFRYQMKASKVLREFSISLLKQSKSIKYVLNVCPQLKNEIIESMPRNLKEKALQDADIFFDIIPENWKRYKDTKTTFIMNLNDDENAYSIFQKMPNFNIDHELLSFFQNPANYREYGVTIFEAIKMITISHERLLKYFRNPYEPSQKVLNYLIDVVSKVIVNENENESHVSVLLHRVYTSIVEVTKIINNFFVSCPISISKSQQIQQRNQQFNRFFGTIPLTSKYINVLTNFVLCLLSTKFGISYNLKDFQTKEKATEFMKICFRFDFPAIALQFMETWGLSDQSTLNDDYALILFKLGRFDDGLNLCIDRRMKKSIRTMSIVDQFYDTCSYSQLFDQNSIEKLLNIDESYYHKIDDEEITNNDEKKSEKDKDETVYIIDEDDIDNNIMFNYNFKIPNQKFLDFITNELQVNGKTLINNSVWNYIQHTISSMSDNESTSNSEQFVFMPMKTTEASLRAANRYLKLKAPLFMRVKKLVTIGNFDKALKLAMDSNNKKIDSNSNGIKFNLIDINHSSNDKAITATNKSSSLIQRRSSAPNTAKRTQILDEKNVGILNNHNSNRNANTTSDDTPVITTDNKTNTTNNSSSNENDEFGLTDSINNSSDNFSNNEITTATNFSPNVSPRSRSTKIVFGTDSITPGSPKKAFISTNNKQRIMQERFNLFLENIFVISISYSNFSKMKVKLLEFDPTLHFFGSLVEKLLQFSMHNNMPHLKYELEMFLGRADSATLTSIELFKETKSMNNLENALKAVKKELANRRQNTKMAPNTLNIEVMESYERIIPLQIKFMKFIQQSSTKSGNNSSLSGFDDLEYNKSLSLFNGKKAAISTVIVLFRKFNFSLALEIIITCELNLLKIADDLCDMIYNERNSSMLKLIRSLEDSFPDEIYMKMINQILLRLFYVIDEGEELALNIIENGVHNEDFRTRLFVQFGQYEKALDNAKKWKLFNLMPLIAHEALMKDPGYQSSQIASTASNMLSMVQRSTSLEF